MRQHSTLSVTPCGCGDTNRLSMSFFFFFLWQLVNFFLAGRCSPSGAGRPARRDETVWTPPDLRRGKRLLVPAALGKIWVVDGWMWTEISRMASALHAHTHTHTAEILVFRAELQLSSFSAYLFFFKQLGSKIT